MPGSRLSRTAAPANRSSRRPDCGSRPSADLAGRSVALSIDVPAVFDAPLAPHHKAIGRWVAEREKSARRYTRHEARARIERVFRTAVLDILKPFELVDLRVVALQGDDELPPALVVICDSAGQLDLGWIETGNVLRETLFARVAPVSWQAAAYKALGETLPGILPISGYEDLVDEFSNYYWDGHTDDESARRCLIEYQGADPDDLAEMLPSAMHAKRPEWMLAKNVAPLKDIPVGLRQALRRLRDAHKALKGIRRAGSAWLFDTDLIYAYVPGIEDTSTFPPLTLVPFEQFARELDDVARHGMEYGFMDIVGLCPLSEAGMVDGWFASLKLGAEFLLAAQDLINLDPAKM